MELLKTSDIKALVEKNFEIIMKTFKTVAGDKSKEILNNDELMGEHLISVHNLLPLPVRLIIRKKAFIEFCLKNRRLLFKEAGISQE
jgi:hypothetical protein